VVSELKLTDRHDLPLYVYECFAKSTHLLEPKLRMSGAMPPIPIYVFMAYIRTDYLYLPSI
jgi:hypothetical protein